MAEATPIAWIVRTDGQETRIDHNGRSYIVDTATFDLPQSETAPDLGVATEKAVEVNRRKKLLDEMQTRRRDLVTQPIVLGQVAHA